jgi:hypothetical protein
MPAQAPAWAPVNRAERVNFSRLIQKEMAAAQFQKPGQGQGRGGEIIMAEAEDTQVVPGQPVIGVMLHHLPELPQGPGQVLEPIPDDGVQEPGMAGDFRILGLEIGGGQHFLELAPGLL